MRIYADTSFLVSLLHPGEHSHAAARTFFQSKPDADWISSAWSQFETFNTLRQFCLQVRGARPEQAEALRRVFKHWHARGSFILETADMDEAVQESAQISAADGSTMRMRSADLLHIALLEQIPHDLFVTRDRDQHVIATRRAFKSQLLP
jgi:predicted nucleic acid-binding protein